MHNGLKRAVNHQKGSSGLCGHPPLESRSFTPILSVFVQQLFAWPNTQTHPCLLSLSVCDHFLCKSALRWSVCVPNISDMRAERSLHVTDLLSFQNRGLTRSPDGRTLTCASRSCHSVFSVQRLPSFLQCTDYNSLFCVEWVSLFTKTKFFIFDLCALPVHVQSVSAGFKLGAQMPVHTKSKVFGMKVLW